MNASAIIRKPMIRVPRLSEDKKLKEDMTETLEFLLDAKLLAPIAGSGLNERFYSINRF
jgi:hypothetical protein